MSEIQIIESALEQAARRRRLQRAWRGLWQGFLAGGLCWLAALIAYKLFPLPPVLFTYAGAVSVLCVVAGFVAGWWRSNSILETARWVDSRQRLEERLSTALEVARQPAPSTWRDLVVRDAARSLHELDLKKLLPYSLPAVSRWALLVMLLGAGLGFVPEYRSKEFLAKKKDGQSIKETGRQMAELVRRELNQRPPALEETKKSLESVAEMGDKFGKMNLTRSEALRDLANAADKLKQEAREMSQNPSLKRMEQAARTPSNPANSTSEALQKQIDALQKSLGDNKAADPNALDEMRRDLQKMQSAAKGLNDKDAAAANAAREKIQQSLADMAKKAHDLGLSLPNLNDAMEALAASQVDQFMKDLKMVDIDLEKLSSMAKTLQNMQTQASQTGKDLAEQLKFGQAETAQSTLNKMIEQLKKGEMSAEEMNKLMDQVSKAAEPGSQFGKVGDNLKKAAKEMKAGEKGEASKSLAEAAKELGELSQQMSDMESLMATLDALQQAQMAIGNGQGFMPGNGKGRGAGKGAPKSRGGFGDWADENNTEIPEFVERWDNSGLARSDQDSRPLADRGDGQLADNLLPTKIKGQITPGGPMPSVTLKGVSIKGQSRVGYTETATAGQSDAQSAQNQEQVPRAYQNAVRDYFDDGKK